MKQAVGLDRREVNLGEGKEFGLYLPAIISRSCIKELF
jgi:hypothetical protein